MPDVEIVDLEFYYAYGFQGRTMMAVRAPFAMPGEMPPIVGRIARIDGGLFEIRSVLRQVTGPIAKGEPIGVEVRAFASGPASATLREC